MMLAKLTAIVLLALQAMTPTPAPRLAGFAVQGVTINLDNFKGKQPVLVVFYRTHE